VQTGAARFDDPSPVGDADAEVAARILAKLSSSNLGLSRPGHCRHENTCSTKKKTSGRWTGGKWGASAALR
jgi:hypothetical protein